MIAFILSTTAAKKPTNVECVKIGELFSISDRVDRAYVLQKYFLRMLSTILSNNVHTDSEKIFDEIMKGS